MRKFYLAGSPRAFVRPMAFWSSIELSAGALIGSLLGLLGLFYLCRSLILEQVVLIPTKSRHNWKPIRILNRACFCNVCEIMLSPTDGLFCDNCRLCAHANACTKSAEKAFMCKDKWLKNTSSIKHLWVKGNLPLDAKCETCCSDIDNHTNTGIFGQRCAWCQRCYDDNCFERLDQEQICDFGEFKDMIYPPYCIDAKRTRESTYMRLHLVGINPPNIENWMPLLVAANAKSGSSTGADVVSLLRGYLHPMQVMELNSRGPQDVIQWAIRTSPRPCRILVAGGDGTIGWVLNSIYTLNVKPIPSVAILPLGTGNDLSRVMGWGAEAPAELDPLKILCQIRKARSVNLDRFDLQIEKLNYRLPIQRHPLKTVHLYNYFSIGVDAMVTYNFHKTRESRFYVLSSRVFNKLLYLCFGTQQIVQRDCENIQEKFDLYLDNKLIQLPELQSLVFLNIDSWGAGCRLCELSNSDTQDKIINSISDGIMEVFGIVSSFHMAQLQCKISKPIRIGQAKNIRLQIRAPCPMQADGEPWIQQPADVRLNSRSQARMLKLES